MREVVKVREVVRVKGERVGEGGKGCGIHGEDCSGMGRSVGEKERRGGRRVGTLQGGSASVCKRSV